MSNNDSAPIPQRPNPDTPMAFLPPEIAFQVTISIYILVGSLGVMIWDILNNLKGDYLLLFKYRITVPTIAYFVSRLGSLGYVLASTIFETAPSGICAQFEKGLDWLYPIAIPATSLLFFFRVRAVFDRNKFVVGFFAFMWLAVLAGCLTVTQGVEGIHIGPTKYCLNGSLEPYVASAAIIPLVNDTLVFLAITWRLMQNAHVKYSLKGGVRTLVFGDYMPVFSKALLQDGQIYYLTTVSTNLLTVIMLYIESVPVAYRTMFTVPNIMLMNVMACRVFRNTKFGLFRETVTSNSMMMSREERSGIGAPIPLSFTGASRNKAGPQPADVAVDMDCTDDMKTISEHRDDEYPADSDKARSYDSQGHGMV